MYSTLWLQSSFASRMSHSCTPNCQTAVMSSGGRLTIAMYTLRHIEVRPCRPRPVMPAIIFGLMA